MILIPILVFIYLVGYVGFAKIAVTTLPETLDSNGVRKLMWVASVIWPVFLFWHLLKATVSA